MRRRVLLAVVALALLALGGAAFAFYEFRYKEPPQGSLDTELAGISVETAETGLVDTGTVPITTTEPEDLPPPESCWRFFGGSPQRALSRPDIDLGVPTKVLWSRKFRWTIEYPPTFCDGVLYVNLQKGRTFAIDAETGRVIWQLDPGGFTASSPAIHDDLVIVSSHSGTVTAYRREDGRKVWRVRTGAKVESSPVVVDETAYFGSTDGRVFAVNANTGAVRWAYDTGGRINSSPSIFGRRLCVSTYAGSVFCLDRRNGKKLWSTYVRRGFLGYESFYASASTDGPRLYTTSRTAKVVAFSGRTGRVLWTYQMGGLGYATPAIAHGHVYVGSFDGNLRSLRATDGKVTWSTAIGGRMLGPAIVVGNLVFAATLDGNAVGVRAGDGKIVWRRSKGRYSPGIATDRHYYFSLGRTLLAIRGRNSPPESEDGR
jgi:outer membrane protein assembly factor BamB